MKLTEAELQELAGQLRCPSGDSGIKVGEMMNFTNSNIIIKTIESLNLKNGDILLEIGPGNGSHVNDIIKAASGIQYHGIDISETMVTEAQKQTIGLRNVAFRLSDGENIPYEDASFDKIFTTNTIYFWKDPEKYTAEIARVLKSGGLISIGFIPKSTMQKIPFAKFGFEMYDPESVAGLLEKGGFIIQDIIADSEFVLSNNGEKIEREIVIITAELK
jgi:ubiquinone/menaquinone biosynthesis C-methylase UbiE